MTTTTAIEPKSVDDGVLADALQADFDRVRAEIGKRIIGQEDVIELVLPTLVAGGGFDHGQHIAINSKKSDAPLLGDLYLTLQQQLGLEAEQFSNARRNLNHLFS